MENERKELLNMTVETIGKDLLGALVQEIKLLPDVWPKMSEMKQNDVIDRLRNRVETSVKMAVHLIASDGRTVVTGDVDSVTVKDGVKAVLKFSKSASNIAELCLSEGGPVLVVLAGGNEHTNGMDEVRGESDQRAMNLGEEYKPESDGEGMDDDDVVDCEFTELPEILDSQKEEMHQAGYLAASEGKEESDCPRVAAELVKCWMSGFRKWQDENPEEEAA